LIYFVAIWHILLPFGIFCCHLIFFVAIWYILWLFGIFYTFWYIVLRKIWQPWSGCLSLPQRPEFIAGVRQGPDPRAVRGVHVVHEDDQEADLGSI
jgi:hypothetical protein